MNDISVEYYQYVFKHMGLNGCCNDAFYINYKPKKQSAIPSSGNVLLLDGTKPKSRSKIECGSCGSWLMPHNFKTEYVFKR